MLDRMPFSDPFQVKLFYNYVTVISLYITYFLCVALVKMWKVCYIKNNVYNCKQYAQCPTSKQQQSIKQHIVLECVSEFLSWDHCRYSPTSQLSVINGYIVGVCLSKLMSKIEWKIFILTNQPVLLEKSQLDLLNSFLTLKAWIIWLQNMNHYKELCCETGKKQRYSFQ